MQLSRCLVGALAFVCASVWAQEVNSPDAKERAKAARELGKSGSENIPALQPLLKDADRDVRLEAVKSLVTIGTQRSIDPLLEATADNDPEVQVRATDGLVNFYMPGYVQSGLQRLTTQVRRRFDRENTDIIDPYVNVREDVVTAIGKLVRGGASMESRANAARAAGILRGREAVPDLLKALHSKDTNLIFESLIALQKINDPKAGPGVVFLMRDLEERVQIAAIETAGLLRAKEAIPDLQRIYNREESDKVRRAALGALAMIPEASSRPLFQKGFTDRDDGVRASAAEGFARLKDPADLQMIQRAFADERKMAARLAQAFALVALGQTSIDEFSPLRYLVNTLNSKSYRGIAEPYLIELARDANLRTTLAAMIRAGTKEEKIGLSRVLAATGDRSVAPQLEALSKDPDPDIASEGLRALRIVRSR
jgi:HEAT repeat protein